MAEATASRQPTDDSLEQAVHNRPAAGAEACEELTLRGWSHGWAAVDSAVEAATLRGSG